VVVGRKLLGLLVLGLPPGGVCVQAVTELSEQPTFGWPTRRHAYFPCLFSPEFPPTSTVVSWGVTSTPSSSRGTVSMALRFARIALGSVTNLHARSTRDRVVAPCMCAAAVNALHRGCSRCCLPPAAVQEAPGWATSSPDGAQRWQALE